MKELIGIAIFLFSIYGGTYAFKSIHETVRKAALEKAAQGLPSLQKFNQSLQREGSKRRSHSPN